VSIIDLYAKFDYGGIKLRNLRCQNKGGVVDFDKLEYTSTFDTSSGS
jgi:hypothetical protein